MDLTQEVDYSVRNVLPEYNGTFFVLCKNNDEFTIAEIKYMRKIGNYFLAIDNDEYVDIINFESYNNDLSDDKIFLTMEDAESYFIQYKLTNDDVYMSIGDKYCKSVRLYFKHYRNDSSATTEDILSTIVSQLKKINSIS